ncbi:hypothetical protein N9189_03015 [Pirellulaceae bacterium]|jgi:hypothetical protein|nr:hypothetical protein [Pirellulaceae bacterium]
MDPRELHRETVRLIKVMQNVKDSDMGLSIKRAEIKKLKKELLTLWTDNKDMIPMTNIPSKGIVLSIAQGYDQKHNTNYVEGLFNGGDYTCRSECSVSEYSDAASVYSDCITEMTELTI